MKNNRQKTTHPEKTNIKKITGLQKLRLEQLEGLAGGPVGGQDGSSNDDGAPPRLPKY